MGHQDDKNYKPNADQLAAKRKAKFEFNSKDIEPKSYEGFVTSEGKQGIPICSILPQFAKVANPKNDPHINKLGEMGNGAIVFGKWTVDMLVSYKRKFENARLLTHKTLYNITASELKKHSPKSRRKNRYTYDLWNAAVEMEKYYIKNEIDHPIIRQWLTHCLASSYSLCVKLEHYMKEYGENQFPNVKKRKPK